MDTVVRIIVGLAALWLLFGGKGVLEKHERLAPARDKASSPENKEARPTSARPVTPAIPAASNNLITSLEFLNKKCTARFTLDRIRVTYYVLAKSARCAVDSLSPCLQEAVRKARLDEEDFQYTYFFDRVLVEGSGILEWRGRQYSVRYDRLQQHGWTKDRRDANNSYTCAGFAYTGKSAIDFISDNIANRELFTPMEEEPFPNGQTASLQPAVDWRTLSVNPVDLPLSVPDARRRDELGARYAARGQKKPAARSFIVLEFPSGERFLTEAADTGSGVQRRAVDWRIGNTAVEINYKESLGPYAKATCYVFDDPTITFEMVLEQSTSDARE